MNSTNRGSPFGEVPSVGFTPCKESKAVTVIEHDRAALTKSATDR